jgi:hypothetical protein
VRLGVDRAQIDLVEAILEIENVVSDSSFLTVR